MDAAITRLDSHAEGSHLHTPAGCNSQALLIVERVALKVSSGSFLPRGMTRWREGSLEVMPADATFPPRIALSLVFHPAQDGWNIHADSDSLTLDVGAFVGGGTSASARMKRVAIPVKDDDGSDGDGRYTPDHEWTLEPATVRGLDGTTATVNVQVVGKSRQEAQRSSDALGDVVNALLSSSSISSSSASASGGLVGTNPNRSLPNQPQPQVKAPPSATPPPARTPRRAPSPPPSKPSFAKSVPSPLPSPSHDPRNKEDGEFTEISLVAPGTSPPVQPILVPATSASTFAVAQPAVGPGHDAGAQNHMDNGGGGDTTTFSGTQPVPNPARTDPLYTSRPPLPRRPPPPPPSTTKPILQPVPPQTPQTSAVPPPFPGAVPAIATAIESTGAWIGSVVLVTAGVAGAAIELAGHAAGKARVGVEDAVVKVKGKVEERRARGGGKILGRKRRPGQGQGVLQDDLIDMSEDDEGWCDGPSTNPFDSNHRPVLPDASPSLLESEPEMEIDTNPFSATFQKPRQQDSFAPAPAPVPVSGTTTEQNDPFASISAFAPVPVAKPPVPLPILVHAHPHPRPTPSPPLHSPGSSLSFRSQSASPRPGRPLSFSSAPVPAPTPTLLDVDDPSAAPPVVPLHRPNQPVMGRVSNAAYRLAAHPRTAKAVAELKSASEAAKEVSGEAASGLNKVGTVVGRGVGEAIMGGAEIIARRGTKSGKQGGGFADRDSIHGGPAVLVPEDGDSSSSVAATPCGVRADPGADAQSLSAVRVIARSALSAFFSVTSSLDSVADTLLSSAATAGGTILNPRAPLVEVDSEKKEGTTGGLVEVGKNAITTYGNAAGAGVGGLVKGLGQGFLEGLGQEGGAKKVEEDSDDDEDVLFKTKKTKEKEGGKSGEGSGGGKNKVGSATAAAH
ncbi:hypothetical protein M427DRAFT_440029 [Gonapodya prolifera JEL478]|uniref:Senescence domain-containing protein n=1 Tax=Gonapodya prolifera (strain JEL478) TaxID=1344416 RepID=A0A139A3K0_GONPJ|nr:hypothetical protein M427DRAFT_440029 [Gonapodya prolifera JEL478]|eukprot:KXS11239.1 hypothetical protein M427DRAFT_440029 [Gonapodya prolifera JEL478]